MGEPSTSCCFAERFYFLLLCLANLQEIEERDESGTVNQIHSFSDFFKTNKTLLCSEEPATPRKSSLISYLFSSLIRLRELLPY